MLPCFSVLRLRRCRGRVRFAVLFSAPVNGTTSKLLPSVVEIATGLAGSTFSNSSTGLSRISANEFPCRTSILIISGDSLYIQCITVQASIFYQNIRPQGPGACTASRAWRDWLPAADGCSSAIYQASQVYAVRHEVDKAFEWLQIAFENHDGGMPGLLVDPLLRDLRADPRYKTLLTKLGLPAAS